MAQQTPEERVRAVRILLGSMLDYLPTPLTGSGLIRRSVPSGPAPGKRVPCGYCRRAGRIRGRRGSRICPLCEGSGWRPRRGPRDKPTHPDYELPWDEYLEEPVEDVQQNPASMPSHLIERTLERLQREQALREGDDSSERFGWERERIVYDRRGSYNELRRALRLLYHGWPPGHAQIIRVYFRGLAIELTLEDERQLDAAEEWLAHKMRGEIRIPPWLVEASAEAKQRSVSELAADGLTAGQIARILRLPKQKVRRVLSDRAAKVPVAADAGAAPGVRSESAMNR